MRFLIAAMLIFLGAMAEAERRVALVIGNGAYQAAPGLPNPVRDATAVAASLERLGFQVLAGFDVSSEEMRRIVREFSVALDAADLALFYYAGHGIQVAGRNYLIPTDARIERESDIDLSTLPLDLVLAQMERAAATRLILLDACRNNPFETRLSRAMGKQRAAVALNRGLAPIETDGGAFIGFATDPGEVAFDGAGRHSPFTSALLRHIEAPGLEINAMMTRVRADVFEATERLQRPWSTSSLLQEVYLAPVAARAAEDEAAGDPRLAELMAWEAIQDSETAEDFAAYLDAYPEGLFRDLAETRRAALALAAPGPGDDIKAIPVPVAVRPVARPAPRLEPAPKLAAEAAPPPMPGPSSADCPACPRTIAIPGGATVMGSDAPGAPASERPGVAQQIAPFRMGAAEITVGEIRRYEAETGRTLPRGCYVWTEEGRMRKRADAYWGAPGYPVTDDSPAACLSWDDAAAYAAWLNEVDPAGGWRLPSEAEFEYAARAGTDGPHYWPGGLEGICAAVNGADDGSRFRWRNRACADGAETPVAAGTFPPNPFGLDSIIGNLWEWTADCWNTTHRDAYADGRARDSGLCASRVLRGGSWDDPVENLRAAYRVGIPKGQRQANVGFRLVQDPR